MSVSALTKQAETGDLSMDAIFTTPDLISKLVPIAPILGPKRLMPSVKQGTVTEHIEEAIQRFQQPTVSYETGKSCTIVNTIGLVL